MNILYVYIYYINILASGYIVAMYTGIKKGDQIQEFKDGIFEEV